MKIAIVLNYFNYNNTIECVNNLLKTGIDRVVIVDNASPNNSIGKLEQQFSQTKDIDMILSPENRGYASGNNYGLHYIEKKYGTDNIVFIVNPDVRITGTIVEEIARFIDRKHDAGMVSAKVNNTMISSWKHTSLLRGFIINSLIIRWILAKLHINQLSYYKMKSKIQKVDVISGAFFGIDQRKFKAVDYFDEGTFLYYEEEILSCKLKEIGAQNYILTDLSYRHIGHTSTNLSNISSEKIYQKSRLYFLTRYNHADDLYVMLYKAVNKIDNFVQQFKK